MQEESQLKVAFKNHLITILIYLSYAFVVYLSQIHKITVGHREGNVILCKESVKHLCSIV